MPVGSLSPGIAGPQAAQGAATPAAPVAAPATPALVTDPAVASGSPPAPTTPQPNAQTGAPAAVGLKQVSFRNGNAVVSWSGAPHLWALPGGPASCSGYVVYLGDSSRAKPLRIAVYPPLTITGLAPGMVVGLAPVYRMPDGSEIAGTLTTITVG